MGYLDVVVFLVTNPHIKPTCVEAGAFERDRSLLCKLGPREVEYDRRVGAVVTAWIIVIITAYKPQH